MTQPTPPAQAAAAYRQQACRSCGAPVLWLQHATTGKAAPLDVTPSATGNIVADLEEGTYAVLSEKHRAQYDDLVAAAQLYTSHFVTCPSARQWRTLGSTTAR